MKPINTTLIIGNGFDLSLGMKTSYKSFYEYLEVRSFFDKHKELPLIEFIHNSIKRELWYDFESIIKEFAMKSVTKDNSGVKKQTAEAINKCEKDAKEAMKLLKKELSEFLLKTDPLIYNSAAMRILLSVLGIDDESINSTAKKLDNIKMIGGGYAFPNNIKIISFNYTDTLKQIERVLGWTNPGIEIRNKMLGESVWQIHGTLQDNSIDDIAFGSDNIVSAPEEYKCLCKAYYLNGNPNQEFLDTLASSERVVIFGHSVHGLDFEYYEDFFMSKPSPRNVYVVCHNWKTCQEIREALIKKNVPQFITYISTDNSQEFGKLCNDILADYNL